MHLSNARLNKILTGTLSEIALRMLFQIIFSASFLDYFRDHFRESICKTRRFVRAQPIRLRTHGFNCLEKLFSKIQLKI